MNFLVLMKLKNLDGNKLKLLQKGRSALAADVWVPDFKINGFDVNIV